MFSLPLGQETLPEFWAEAKDEHGFYNIQACTYIVRTYLCPSSKGDASKERVGAMLCWQTSVLPRGPLLASDYKALLLALEGRTFTFMAGVH